MFVGVDVALISELHVVTWAFHPSKSPLTLHNQFSHSSSPQPIFFRVGLSTVFEAAITLTTKFARLPIQFTTNGAETNRSDQRGVFSGTDPLIDKMGCETKMAPRWLLFIFRFCGVMAGRCSRSVIKAEIRRNLPQPAIAPLNLLSSASSLTNTKFYYFQQYLLLFPFPVP